MNEYDLMILPQLSKELLHGQHVLWPFNQKYFVKPQLFVT